jgi:hypothetical protein
MVSAFRLSAGLLDGALSIRRAITVFTVLPCRVGSVARDWCRKNQAKGHKPGEIRNHIAAQYVNGYTGLALDGSVKRDLQPLSDAI